jgi:hypothetical protein
MLSIFIERTLGIAVFWVGLYMAALPLLIQWDISFLQVRLIKNALLHCIQPRVIMNDMG